MTGAECTWITPGLELGGRAHDAHAVGVGEVAQHPALVLDPVLQADDGDRRRGDAQLGQRGLGVLPLDPRAGRRCRRSRSRPRRLGHDGDGQGHGLARRLEYSPDGQGLPVRPAGHQGDVGPPGRGGPPTAPPIAPAPKTTNRMECTLPRPP